MKRLVAGLLLIAFVLMLAGCEPPKKVAKAGGPPSPPPPPGSAPPPAATPAPAAPTSAPRPAVLPPETKVGVFAGNLDDLARGPAAEAAQRDVAQPEDPNLERLKAGKGVGAKGRSLDQYEGVYVTPAKTLFAAKERIVFEIQFPSQYQIYKAMSDDVPKDFADLKAKVLDPYMIKLPELTPGAKYVWDAATEELLVERPKLKVQ